jgi:cytochrome c2
MGLAVCRKSIAILALAAALAAPHAALGQSGGGNAESGRLYAEAWCTECHSVAWETAGTGKFAPDFTAIAQRRRTTARTLSAFLRSSHKIMPDFEFKRSEQDDIVAHILSLRRR